MNKAVQAFLDRLQQKYSDVPDRLTKLSGLRRWRAVVIAVNYLREIKVGGETAGVTFYSQLWRFGLIGRVGLILLIIGLPVVGLSVTEQLQQIGVVNSIPLVALVAGLLLFSAGWAFILAVSMRAHLAIHCVACIYLFYYGLMPALGYLLNPAFAIPIIWALYLVRCRLMESALKSWWPLWIAPVCILAGYLTFPSFGLHTLFEEPLKTWMKLLLGAAYFAMVTIRVQRFATPPGSLAIFLTSWLLLLFTYLAAGIADIEALADSTMLGFQGMITFFSLFLMWLGISFFNGALGLGSWVAREWFVILPKSVALWTTILIWLLAALFCWLTVHDVPGFIELIALSLRQLCSVDNWPYELFFAAYGHFYLSLALEIIAIILAFRRRLVIELLLLMNGLWVAGFFMLMGYYATSYNVAEFGKEQLDGSFWTLLLFIGGLTWSIIKSGLFWKVDGNNDKAGMNFNGMFAMVAMLLLMEGVTAVLLAAGDQQLVVETRLQPLLGITFIGIPYLCYSVYLQLSGHPPIPSARLVMLFALGCLSAFVCIGIDAYAGPHLILAPAIWLAVLLLQKWRLQKWRQKKHQTSIPADGSEGSISGMAMAFGFIAYWMIPMVIPIPFLELLHDWQGSYTLDPPVRPFMETGQFLLTSLAVACGATIGFIIASDRLHMATRTGFALAAVAVMPILGQQVPGMSAPLESDQPLPASLTGQVLPQEWQFFVWESQDLKVGTPNTWQPVIQDTSVPTLNLGYDRDDGFFQMFYLSTSADLGSFADGLLTRFDPTITIGPVSIDQILDRDVVWISWSQMYLGNQWQALDALVKFEGAIVRIQTVGLVASIEERSRLLKSMVGTLYQAEPTAKK